MNMKLRKKDILLMLAIGLVSCVIACSNVLMPVVFKNILDNMLAQNALRDRYIIIYGLLIGLVLISEFLSKLMTGGLKKQISQSFRNSFVKRLLFINARDFGEKSPQDYISIINNDLPEVIDGYYIKINQIVFQVLSILIGAFTLSSIYLPLAAISVLSSLAIILVPIFMKNILGGLQEEYFESLKLYNNKAGGLVYAYSEIRLQRMVDSIKSLVNMASDENLDKQFKFNRMESLSEIIIGLISFLSLFLTILIGGIQVNRGLISVGGLVCAIQLSDVLVQPILGISCSLNTFVASERVKKTIDKYFCDDFGQKNSLKRLEEVRDIVFENISVRSKDRVILESFNYKFTLGKNCLIIGENGSGKSTLIKLLINGKNIPGLEVEGRVLINGIPREEIDEDSLFEKISIVQQKPYIFPATVVDNIWCFSNQSSLYLKDEDDLKKILGKNLYDKMSSGEEIEDNTISGGEGQRIAIARALRNKSDFIVMDESLSQIDPESRLMIEGIVSKIKGLTIIHISHDNKDKEKTLYSDKLFMAKRG